MRPEPAAQFDVAMPKQYIELTTELQALTLEIVNNTIFRERHNYHMNMVPYARDIVNSLKRPFIMYSRSDSYVRIEIPNKKYLTPIRAPLDLAVSPGATSVSTHSIGRNDYIKAHATFYFHGAGNVAVFDQWLARTQEDPEWRKALRLPPK